MKQKFICKLCNWHHIRVYAQSDGWFIRFGKLLPGSNFCTPSTQNVSPHKANRTRFVFHTLRQLQPDLIPQPTMDPLPHRKTDRKTGIRTRCKSLTSRSSKRSCDFWRNVLESILPGTKEKETLKKGIFWIFLVCIGSSISIKADTYDAIESP